MEKRRPTARLVLEKRMAFAKLFRAERLRPAKGCRNWKHQYGFLKTKSMR
jgi:hypothetical protein